MIGIGRQSRFVRDTTFLTSFLWIGLAFLALYPRALVCLHAGAGIDLATPHRGAEVSLPALALRMLRYRVALMLGLFFALGLAWHQGAAQLRWTYLLGLAALASSYICATCLNDVADREIDAVNHAGHKGRPLVTGEARAVHLSVQFDGKLGRGEQPGLAPAGLIPPTSRSLPLTHRAGDTQSLDRQLHRS